ncbi:hypothetical protein [Vreelandella zhuhanensis]|nr:hypothetical protein [Halomonas zhuhanensis]
MRSQYIPSPPVPPMKKHRDTRVRNLVFLIAVTSAIVVGLWLAR